MNEIELDKHAFRRGRDGRWVCDDGEGYEPNGALRQALDEIERLRATPRLVPAGDDEFIDLP